MARISVMHKSGSRKGTVEVYPTNRFQSLYFGRDPSCDVQFDLDGDDLVSRSHCVIEWDEDQPDRFTISDLLSSNGTLLNGKPVTGAQELKTGDTLQLGEGGPLMEIEITSTNESHQWIDNENIALDENRRTRQAQAIPEERDLEYEAERAKNRKD